jgi:hypothetical protein
VKIMADHRGQALRLLPVVSGHAVSGMHIVSAVMPGQEFFHEFVVYFALTLQHCQDFITEYLFQFF